MIEWITDREPTADDAHTGWVWVTTEHGVVLRQSWDMVFGRPWQPIVRPEPYVKAKRYWVRKQYGCWFVYDTGNRHLKGVADNILTREAAERIAAIYEEMMP